MMMIKHEVKEVKICGQVGFQIQALYRDCSDSFWEPVAHAAVFSERARAERLLERVKRKGSWEIDWSQWGVAPGYALSVTCAIQRYAPFYCVL